jgi:hypothetical protein
MSGEMEKHVCPRCRRGFRSKSAERDVLCFLCAAKLRRRFLRKVRPLHAWPLAALQKIFGT